MPNRWVLLCCCAGLLLGLAAKPARADAMFSAFTDASSNSSGNLLFIQSASDTHPVTANGTFSHGDSGNLFSADGFASAGRSLGASARTTALINSPGAFIGLHSIFVFSSASFSLPDLVFSGGSGGNIPITALLNLNGTLTANLLGSNPAYGDDGAELVISGDIYDPNGNFSVSFHGFNERKSDGTFLTTGVLAKYGGSGFFEVSVPAVSVPTNKPLAMDLTLTTEAFYNYVGNGVDAFSDFSHTLSFPTSGPAFIVPAGYTVNSADGGIVDNRFVTATAVPEPASLVLLATGIAAVAASRKKLTRRR